MPWLLMLADFPTSVPTDGTIGALIGTMAGGGFSLWYGWFTTTKTLPQKDAEHRTSIREIVDKFDESLTQLREQHREDLQAFWAELKEERAARRADTLQIVEALRRLNPAASA